jgi:hypothetical protein
MLLPFLLLAFSESSVGPVRQIMRQDDDFSSANEIREGETIVILSSHPDNTCDYNHMNLSRPETVWENSRTKHALMMSVLSVSHE